MQNTVAQGLMTSFAFRKTSNFFRRGEEDFAPSRSQKHAGLI